MSVGRLAAAVVVALAGCADATGLILEVRAPTENPTSVQVAELRLVMTHTSWCHRVVADTEASSLSISVAGRDLATDPVRILVTPDQHTALGEGMPSEPVRAIVLALDAAGQLVGKATFASHPFVYEQVIRYAAPIDLLGRGAQADGPRYATADGCVCVPGLPLVGRPGAACDTLVPPSFDDLMNTAECELPPGADLPIGVCDGQLYPGERQGRAVPCYVASGDSCRIGQRTCADTEGVGYDKECAAGAAATALPSGALCKAFLDCERDACVDPIACLKTKFVAKNVHCTLPISLTAANGTEPCAGGSWVLAGPSTASGAACVAAMIDGTRQGPVKIGWQTANSPDPQVVSTQCPPTLLVGAVGGDPAKLPAQVEFSISIGDDIFHVTVDLLVECGTTPESRSLRCDAF